MSLGGAERHVADVASGLRRRGWQPSIFVFSRSGPLLSKLEEDGVPVFGPKPSELRDRWLGKRFSAWVALLQGSALLIVTLLRCRNTVVHFFLPEAYIVGGISAYLVGAHPRIMSRRSLNRYQITHPYFRSLERFLHPRMDLLVGNSLAVIRELEAESQRRSRIRLIYNGIDVSRAQGVNDESIRHELGLDASSGLVFVIVANLIAYKGHSDLLFALAGIKKQLPDGWSLLCVGRDDGILSSLQNQAQTLGIAANVRWLGMRMDVYDCFAVADIAISSSHEEGFSNAVLEAMMAKLPMVVTDVGGNSEVVVDGVTGYIVPAHSPQELGAALLKLVADDNRGEMGKRGWQRVTEHFSMKACLDQYEAIYEESRRLRM